MKGEQGAELLEGFTLSQYIAHKSIVARLQERTLKEEDAYL